MINIKHSIKDQPFNAIDPEVLELIDSITNIKALSMVKKALECFLRVTNQKLNLQILKEPEFQDLSFLFIGAMYSSTLFDSNLTSKYEIASAYLALVQQLKSMDKCVFLAKIQLSRTYLTSEILLCISKFERIKLNEEQLWLCQGWPCPTKNGMVIWAPLFPLYERFGVSFTSKFHSACAQYTSSGNASRITCLKQLIEYIQQYEQALKEEDFKDPLFINTFWREFLIYYLQGEYAKGVRLHQMVNRWRGSFVTFVNRFLIPTGLFVETYGEMPSPPIISMRNVKTNIKASPGGGQISKKLITEIPLQVSDEEAMHLLFRKIQDDVDIAVNWATWAVEDLWRRYTRRLKLSQEGQLVNTKNSPSMPNKNWLVSSKNPDQLKNVAATLSHHNHFIESKFIYNMLPKPLSDIAYELGLPTSAALLPHCILLIANHPAITQSFLESLELFDKNEKIVGFVENDGIYRLIGKKERRGPLLGQQKIILNEKAISIVKQLIELTNGIREYLKSKGDDNWRYLLLTSGHGFGYPKRVKRISTLTSAPRHLEALSSSLRATCDLNLQQRINYVSRFSLTALRASCGVLVYIKTRSLKEMSLALGHAQLESNLINHYLPESILSFFQERWIRIFQSAILIEALKESPFLIEASGFENISEVHEFLKNHAMKLPPLDNSAEIDSSNSPAETDVRQIVFGVNTSILKVMLSLKLAVDNATKSVNEKAKYWAEITEHLVDHIEANESYRPDLKSYLDHARKISHPAMMEDLIYD